MKRTSGLILMAVGILFLTRVAPALALQTSGSTAIRTGLSKTSVVAAEDAGDDGDDSDSDSDDAE